MIIPIDVIVSFSLDGDMFPKYFSYTDQFNINHTFKVEKILVSKNEMFAGIKTILFECIVFYNGEEILVKLKYFNKNMKWALVYFNE